MTEIQAFITIAAVAAVTLLTRAIPFLIFPADKKSPPLLRYLGEVLPCAIVGMLVVYCLKNTDFTSASHWIPEGAAAVFVAAAHKWRHNLLLSIVGGTAVYMILLRII